MSPAASTLTGDPPRFKGGLREVARGAYAWMQPNGAWGEANAGLVVGDGASLLIDTLWDERLAREMLTAMAPHTAGAPIRTALNTHSDGDHWWGNNALPSSTEIITCTASHEAMKEEATPQRLATMARLARATRRAPGSVGRLSAYIDRMLSPLDLNGVTLRWPDRVFEGPTETLDIGGREAILHVLGPAHTPGDTIVHVPDVRTVFAADLLFVGAIPVMWHGPSTGWVAALQTLLDIDADVYVPGHGDVGGRADVEVNLEFWNWLREATQQRLAAGEQPLRVSEALIRSDDFRPYVGWECPERLHITVTALAREHAGKPPMKVTPAVRARLFREVAALQRRLDGAR